MFNQRGYEGCSLREIMAKAGIEKGGIYRHFASKEELALEAFDFAWAEVFQRRMRGLAEIKDPLLRVERFILNFAEQSPVLHGGCPLLNTAIDADDGNAALRARARGALDNWRMRLSLLISIAMQRGLVRPDTEPCAVATIIIATLEGALMVSRLEKNAYALVTACDHLISWVESLRVETRVSHGDTERTHRR